MLRSGTADLSSCYTVRMSVVLCTSSRLSYHSVPYTIFRAHTESDTRLETFRDVKHSDTKFLQTSTDFFADDVNKMYRGCFCELFSWLWFQIFCGAFLLSLWLYPFRLKTSLSRENFELYTVGFTLNSEPASTSAIKENNKINLNYYSPF